MEIRFISEDSLTKPKESRAVSSIDEIQLGRKQQEEPNKGF